MRELLLALVLLTAGLAGCIGDDAGDLEQANATDAAAEATNASELGTLPDGEPVPLDIEMADCYEQTGVFPVPAEAVGELPEGFEPVPFDPAGQTATMLVIALDCSLPGDEDHSEVWGMVEVEPPEELAAEDAAFSLIALSAISSTERRAHVYEAWGMGEDEILAGDVTVETLAETPPARGGHVLGTDDDFTVHLYTATQGPPTPEEAGQARVFGVADAEVTGMMDVSWTDSEEGLQGEALLDIEDGGMDLPRPEGAGIAVHWWGGFDFTYEHVDLDETA